MIEYTQREKKRERCGDRHHLVSLCSFFFNFRSGKK